MIWQDGVLAACSVGLIIFLVPAVTSSTEKPPLKTALASGVFLGIMATVFVSLGVYLTATAAYMQALLWCMIAGQIIGGRRA